MIEAEESLLLQTPESLHARFNLDVRVNNRVTKIDRENKQVTVANLKDNTEYQEGYDQLVLSTGAKPRMVPIPGLERALVLRDVQDAVKIKALVDTSRSNRQQSLEQGSSELSWLRTFGTEGSRPQLWNSVTTSFLSSTQR